MNLEQYIKESFTQLSKDYEGKKYCFRNRVYCNDGFNISIQGSWVHYCSPRLTQDSYDSVELGYPSEYDELIFEYAENKEIPTETVYGYVPVDLVQKMIDSHGGIDVKKTFKS